MFKSLTVMLALQVFVAACDENLKIETVGRSSPALSEDYCVSNPQIAGCNDFLKKPALSLGQMVPINSYQDHVVRLRGNVFTDDLKITLEGLDVPIFKISSTDAFFITPSFASSGIKTGVLKNLDSSIEFKLYILAEKVLNPETLTEPSVVCQDTSFMLADGTVALGTKACGETTAASCSADSGAGCTEPLFISDSSDVVTNTVVTLAPTVTGASSYAWSQVSGPGVLTFASPGAKASAVSAPVDGSYVVRLSAANSVGIRAQKDILLVKDTAAPAIGNVSDIFTKLLATIAPSVTGAASYAWSQVSGPGAIVFANPTAQSTAVYASADGNYVIRLIATDAAGNSAQKDFNFIADTLAPSIGNVSDILARNLVSIAPLVTGASSYAWSQVSGPGTITFANSTADATALSASTDGHYQIRLVASDAAGNSAQKDFNFTWDTLAPQITTASSVSVFGKLATLTPSVVGGATYLWSVVSGPGVADFVDDSTLSSTLTVDTFGTYTLNFAAQDQAGNVANQQILLTFAAPQAQAIVAGGYYSCAILQDNSVKCWGTGGNGQLGYGNTSNLLSPSATTIDLGSGKSARALALSDQHSCALLNDYSVKCWGSGYTGQLGVGFLVYDQYSPSGTLDLGQGKTALAIAAGYEHTCALLNDNTVKCWGEAWDGRLGYGSLAADLWAPPAPSINLGPGKTALAIATGKQHTCALLNDNSVKCWGTGGNGQLGLGNTSSILAPAAASIDLGPGKTALAIAAGSNHTCALLNDNSVKCWGDGSLGQLGLGNTTSISSPSATSIDLGLGKTALAISAGEEHSCALLNDNSVKCWGDGWAGKLGLGNTTSILAPAAASIDLGPGKTALAISTGYYHTCALLNDSSVKCWGYGSNGQLGLGNTADVLAPTASPINLMTD